MIVKGNDEISSSQNFLLMNTSSWWNAASNMLNMLRDRRTDVGAESLSRSHQPLCSSKISQYFIDPEGLLPCSQEPATCPILSQMNPVHTSPSYFPQIRSLSNFPPVPTSSYCPLSLLLSYQNSVHIPLPYHASYMACPTNSLWLDQPHYSRRRVQVMKPIIMKSSPVFFYAIPLTIHTVQQPALKPLNL
jgi:hypothetical protein